MADNEFSGTSYGTVVQGQDLVLSLPAAPPVAMAGLPAQPVFVGRDRELGLLTTALHSGDPRAVVVWALGGLGGIGKTALAVRAAQHALREGWFPGGVVMVNLRGYDPPGDRVSASAALASLLGALGVAGQHIPAEAEDRARLWRSVLAERERTLVVADNASSAEQVRPLLPGTAGHRMLVTSRHRLADLDGARLMDVDVLPTPEAVDMLAEALVTSDPDDRRVLDDPTSAELLVRLCGGLPLAVRVTAALLVADPDRSVAEFADDLADDRQRLEELRYNGSLAVRAAFDLSYRHLEEHDARLFRLVALNPGPEIGIGAVAALGGIEVAEARRSVRELARAHLLQPGSAAGRWRMHDLVKLYASDEGAGDPEEDRAVDRLLDHYLSVGRTGLLVYREEASPEERRDGPFAHGLEVLEWADAERVNLMAAIALALRRGRYAYVVEGTADLYNYLHLREQWDDLLSSHRLALTAALRLGDRVGAGRVLNRIGVAHRHFGQFDEALDCHRRALATHREIGARGDEGLALNYLGQVHREAGRLPESIDSARRALVIFREEGMRSAEAAALHNLAVAHRMLGRRDEAIDYHLQDLRTCRDLGERISEGRVLDHLAIVYRELGRFAEAVEHHLLTLRITREMGDTNGEARGLLRLGTTYREWGRAAEAIACLRDVPAFFRESGDRRREGAASRELGLALRLAGDEPGARRHLAVALEVFESLPGAGPAASAAEVRALLATNE